MPKVTDAHRLARREQILEAAFRCVAREGFHKTTMAHVIAESGLSAGAVYGYFTSKQELIRAISDVAVSGLSEAIDRATALDPLPLPEVALQMVLEEVDSLGEAVGVELPRVAVQAWAEAVRDEEVRTILAGRLDQIRAAWIRYAERAQRSGVLADGDPAEMGQTLVGLMPGFVLSRLILDDVSAESYASGLAALRRQGRGR